MLNLTLQEAVIVKSALNMLSYPSSLVPKTAPLLDKIEKEYLKLLEKVTPEEKQALIIPTNQAQAAPQR